MVRSTETLAAEMLTLPQAERARLAEVLLASLDADEGSAMDIAAAWQADGERRLAELRNGTVAGVPAEQVFAAARARIAR